MNTCKIISPPKTKFSWVKEILSLKPKEMAKIPKEFAKTVTPIISRDVRLKEPFWEFETDRVSDPDYMILTRNK